MASGLTLIFCILLGFLALGGIGYVISLFNSLIQVRNNIGKAWVNIDVLLLQRNEEIPKLIDLTKSYVRYEKEVLESLTRLRTLYGSTKRTEVKALLENQMVNRIQELRRTWEWYPDLKANASFLQLQQRISDLESTIADRRIFFNESVTIYNIQRESYPQTIFAKMLGFTRHPLLDIPREKKA
jgi:LemA protein